MKLSSRFLSSRFLPSASRGANRPLITHSNNRFFSTAHVFNPHSEEHIQLQQKLFKLENIPTKITILPEGTKLIGLNVTPVKPRYLGTAPLYTTDILDALSPSEKDEWQEMVKTYYAQMGKYELLCDVTCITSLSENGTPIHYIDHSLLDVISYTPIEKLVDLDTTALKMK
ncbi:hypothetical protein [Legionella fallonii]|nr:hypothetical protein [Legionella fallonii]